jgi:hypothetical protein
LNKEAVIDIHENFVKQSYRNRATIAAPQGVHNLIIPVKWKNKQPLNEVKIAYEFKWQREHQRALKTTYSNSPYYEFYEAYFKEIFETKYTFLYEFNLVMHQLILRLLGQPDTIRLSENYLSAEQYEDYRSIIHPKKEPVSSELKPYLQVFTEAYGFLPYLSICDLLFNLGPESASYLNSHVSR